MVPRRSRLSRVGGHARRAGRAALSTSDITMPLIAAAAFGLLKKENIVVPHFGPVGEAGTIAIAGFAALKMGVVPASLRPLVRNAVLVAGALAAYEFASTGSLGDKAAVKGSGPWDAHETSGDED
jgi:hypothetical protein